MTDISFFLTTGKAPQKAKAKAKPEATGISKRDRAAIAAYLAASPAERRAMLRNQGDAEKQAKLVVRRSWRRDYMRQWRSMKLWTTILF